MSLAVSWETRTQHVERRPLDRSPAKQGPPNWRRLQEEIVLAPPLLKREEKNEQKSRNSTARHGNGTYGCIGKLFDRVGRGRGGDPLVRLARNDSGIVLILRRDCFRIDYKRST